MHQPLLPWLFLMREVHKAQINMGLTTAHTLKTSITSEIAKQCVIVFQFSCQRADFLGSRAVDHFEEKGLKDWGNQAGFQCADQEV